MLLPFLFFILAYSIIIESAIVTEYGDTNGIEEVSVLDFNSKSTLQTHKCFLTHKNVCRFNNLNLTLTDPYFQPESDISAVQVNRVDLGGSPYEWSSIVIVLTSDVCRKFQNVRKYYARALEMEHIQSNAFEACNQLEHLDLGNNSLTWLDPNTFKRVPLLKVLILNHNKLRSFDAKIFHHLPKLGLLNLLLNNLTLFPIESLDKHNNLQTIMISGNKDLAEFDEKEIFHKLPKLRWFWARGSQNVDKTIIWQQLKYLEQHHVLTDLQFCKTPEGECEEENFDIVTYENQLPVFLCRITLLAFGSNFCLFDTITLNETHKHFVPKSNIYAKEVTEVGFYSGKMHTFTSDLCNAFPHTKVIFMPGLGIQMIEVNAFVNCLDLEKLLLDLNPLKQLNPHVFRQNMKLKEITMHGTQMDYVDPRVFNHLSNLEVLSFSSNNMTNFPITEFSVKHKLVLLSLQKNHLKNLNVTELMTVFPNLRMITICENYSMSEEELERVKKMFESRSVKVVCFDSDVLFELDAFT